MSLKRDPLASTARPANDDVVGIDEALAWQRDHCDSVGSPLAAGIIDAIADDIASGGPLADSFAARVRFGDLPGLRAMSVVHLLALERQAPLVALHLPTLGGTPPRDEAAWRDWQRAVVDALVTHPEALAEGLSRVPQTNETGRAILLRAALGALGADHPVRLMEIGASAGLNLRADHLPGDPALEVGPLPLVAERIGCDQAPIDPTTQEGRALLSSYVWVDDVERFARLGRALDVASRVSATVVRQEAAEFVERIELVPSTVTVLWHSAMWVYLDADTRRRVLEASAQLGRQAHDGAGFAHVSWEWHVEEADAADTHELVLREWGRVAADGRPRLFARGPSHGPGSHLVPVTVLDSDPLADT